MANTLGLDLAIVAQKALPHLQTAAPLISAFTTDLSPEIKGGGESITTRYVATQTASIWSSTFAPSDVTATKVACTLREPFYNSVGFSPNEQASYTEQTLADSFIGPFIQGVVDEVVKYAFSTAVGSITANVYSASGAAFGFDELQSSVQFLLTSGSTSPTVLLNAVLENALNKDLAGLYGGSAMVINQDGLMYGKQVGKATVYPYYGMTKLVAGLAGVAMSPAAVVLATRIPPALSNVEQQIITDPRTGLSVSIERWPDATLGKVIYAVKLCAGAVAGRTNQLKLLRDTDNV